MCEAKGIYWHADFAELRRSTYTSIMLTLTQVMFFESADFVARACPATAGAGESGAGERLADERGAASLRLIAALLLVNRNGVAGESSPCDWVSFNRGEATLTSDTVAINRCSAAFNLSSSDLTKRYGLKY